MYELDDIKNKMKLKKSNKLSERADVVFLHMNCQKAMKDIADNQIDLILTSPPYNINKEYEDKIDFKEYLKGIETVATDFYRILSAKGSICWQVGNHVDKGEIYPLDILTYDIFKQNNFKLRNRIIWHFNHGLHGKKRLSGRYETMMWFTKTEDYTFNLDDIRIPQKYPGKRHHKKGENYDQPSGNPLGKNPSDYWEILKAGEDHGFWDIPNVKANHAEKTLHPCSFPIELVERCILAYTNKSDLVFDPFAGVGTTMLGALMHERRAIGCELKKEYMDVAKERVQKLEDGTLPYRPLGKPIHTPTGKEKVARKPDEWHEKSKN